MLTYFVGCLPRKQPTWNNLIQIGSESYKIVQTRSLLYQIVNTCFTGRLQITHTYRSIKSNFPPLHSNNRTNLKYFIFHGQPATSPDFNTISGELPYKHTTSPDLYAYSGQPTFIPNSTVSPNREGYTTISIPSIPLSSQAIAASREISCPSTKPPANMYGRPSPIHI